MANASQKGRRIAAPEVQKRLRASGTAQQLGFELAALEQGRVVLRMRVQAHHKQFHGVVHGGVLAALADTAGGLASYTAASGPQVATIEMKINYLEPVAGGTVTADARVVRIGRHIAVVDCDIRDQGGRLVGKALMSFFVGQFRESRAKTRVGGPRASLQAARRHDSGVAAKRQRDLAPPAE
jgi:uncharacterized protein (TIGR00369 family)